MQSVQSGASPGLEEGGGSTSEGTSDEESPDHHDVEQAVDEVVGPWSGGFGLEGVAVGTILQISLSCILGVGVISTLTMRCSMRRPKFCIQCATNVR